MDNLSNSMFKLSLDVSDITASLWRRTLKMFLSQLQKKLRDFAQGISVNCWPSLGKLLLLKFLGGYM